MTQSSEDTRDLLEQFRSGSCTRLYEYFGAHINRTESKRLTTFRVWAPNAESISVVGSFNDLNEDSHRMAEVQDGIWELVTEDAREGDSYKYLIKTRDGQTLLKSDPFAFFAQYRPDNASRVCLTGDFGWEDGDWLESRAAADFPSMPINIYELHLGSWKRRDGKFLSYEEIAEELVPYIVKMGYTHVDFLPVTEHPYDPSLGYQTTGYFAATSRHGTPNGLRYLINELHKAGVGVILDWVPASFPKDEFGLIRFDGTPLYENSDPLLGERVSWGTCLFDYSKPQVVSFLISSAVFWLKEFHFDGLRVGALTSMLYLDYDKDVSEWRTNKFGGKENLEAIDFLKALNTATHGACKGIMMFGDEHTSWQKLTLPIEEGGLNFDFKWNKGWITDMINYISLPSEWRPFNHDNLTYSFFYAFSEKYLLPVSHDEISLCRAAIRKQRGAGDPVTFAEFRAFFTYMYAHPGKKLLFMGTEIGQIEPWDYDGELKWDLLGNEKRAQLNCFFGELNRFYRSTPPLYELDTGWKGFDWIHHDDFTNSVIAFKRIDKNGGELIAVCNFQPVRHDGYLIGVPKDGLYDEVFNSDELRFGGEGLVNGTGLKSSEMKIHGCNYGISLTLPPLGVVYLRYSQQNGEGA